MGTAVVTLADLLFDSDRPGDEMLVHAAGIDVSRGEVVNLAGDIARGLADLGVQHGQPVAVMLPNGAGVVAALFGVWRAGGAYLPLNPRATERERARILDRLRPAAIVTTPDRAEEMGDRPHLVLDGMRVRPITGPVAGRAAGAPGAESLGGEPLGEPTPCDSAFVSTAEPAEQAKRELDEASGRTYPLESIALIQFTSGTTGEPKAVQLTHRGVRELLDGVVATLGGDRTGRNDPPVPNLVPVSMSLWAGIYQVLFALRVGAAIVAMDGFETVEFRRLVRRFGIRSTVLPPAAMTALADDERIDGLTPLRYVRSITAPLSPLQARRFHDRFDIAVLNSYGQTEIGGEIVGWSGADWKAFGASKLGAVGRPHRGVALRAVAPNGTPLPIGETGELWVKTPALAAGYADGRDFGDRLTPDGWFRTGDIGRHDSDGFVWIDGRVSDMINRGGLKVHPGEVQEVLLLDPAVADCAVVGVPDERLGEVPWAFVVAAPSATIDPEALAARCRIELAPYKVPVRFVAIDALPRNEVGKVLTLSLIERAQG